MILIYIKVLFFLSIIAYSSDKNAVFSLKTTDEDISIETGDVKVRTLPGQLRFIIEGPYGTYYSNYRSASRKLAAIKIIEDSDEVKNVLLTSEPFNWNECQFIFTLDLKIKQGFSLLFVNASLKIISELSVKSFFFLQLSPLKSDYYETEDGENKIRSKRLKFKDWLFLPHDNMVGGTGLIMNTDNKHIQLITDYPKKNWRKNGLYFLVNYKGGEPKTYKKNENNSLKFIIFPANDADQTEEYFEQIGEKSGK